MSKKKKAQGIKRREEEKQRNLAKAEKLRSLAKEREEVRLKATIEALRNGKLKIKKSKPNKGMFSVFSLLAQQSRIRSEDVVIDTHTSPKKTKKEYRLEGDTGWLE